MPNFTYFLFISILTHQTLWGAFSQEILDHYVQQVQDLLKVPGIAVAIVKEDGSIFTKGYGVRNIDSKQPITEDTVFLLASVSKTFTSAGLAAQVDRGRLKWDDAIQNFIPFFKLNDLYASRFATSRDLLAHRTGLPSFKGDLLGKLGIGNKEIIHRIRYIEPETSFREKGLYSNVGFFLAGELLAQISGTTFEKAIKATLLDPLGMDHSGFSDKLDGENVSAAHAFIKDKIQVIPFDKQTAFTPAGGVTSTARDMAKWMLMHLKRGKQVIKHESIDEMHKPSMVTELTFAELPPINENSSLSYGLGWTNYNYKGQVIVEKGGALDGVRTVVTLIPQMKVGIAILANLNLTVIPELIRARFLEMHLGQEPGMEQEILAKQKIIDKLIQPEEQHAKEIHPGKPLNAYTGDYRNDLYGQVSIKADGNKLILLAGPAKWKGSLTHISNDTFLLRWPAIDAGTEQITFVMGLNQNAKSMETETLGTFTREEAF